MHFGGSPSTSGNVALALVLAAACVHAGWNLLAKRVRGDVVAFVWLCSALSVALWLPVALIAVATSLVTLRFDATALGLIVGTGAIHLAYFVLLQTGYKAGAISLVYPLARATGPLIASVAAVVWLGERPGALGAIGIAAIVAGGLLAATGGGGAETRPSIGYGVGTGATIAAYTLWDKFAVATAGISPLPYDVGRQLVQVLALGPIAFRRRAAVAELWRTARWESVGIAILSPLAYILVLFALTMAPVTLVAPAREVSIVFGTLIGARVFAEGNARRRGAAAALMFAGIVALAVR